MNLNTKLPFFVKLAAICEIAFHYKDKIDPIDYVCNIASNMSVSNFKIEMYFFCLNRKFEMYLLLTSDDFDNYYIYI